jgi:mRNA interferase MazF
VVAHGDIVWADLGPPAGWRPVCVPTRDAALAVLTAITCAPITRTMRGIRSEVEVGTAEGLPASSVITCDNVITVLQSDISTFEPAPTSTALRARHPILTTCRDLV